MISLPGEGNHTLGLSEVSWFKRRDRETFSIQD